MTDIGLMFKSLNLAWVARLLATGKRSWCTVPNHFFRKMGGLDFILRCNYNAKYFNQLPIFYKNILDSFSELKTLYGYDQSQDIVLFNNKDILVDGNEVYINEWFKKGVVSIKDLLKNDGKFLTFKEFYDKYGCQTNFLQYYQIISAIPNRLLTKAKDTATFNKLYFTSNNKSST